MTKTIVFLDEFALTSMDQSAADRVREFLLANDIKDGLSESAVLMLNDLMVFHAAAVESMNVVNLIAEEGVTTANQDVMMGHVRDAYAAGAQVYLADDFAFAASIEEGAVIYPEVRAGDSMFDRVAAFVRFNGHLVAAGTDAQKKFLWDMRVLAMQFMHAFSTVEVFMKSRYTLEDCEPQYAGGVVSPGNRFYTYSEAAKNAQETVQEYVDRAKAESAL